MRQLLLAVLMLSGVVESAAGQAPPSRQTPNPHEARQQAYSELRKKVFAGAMATAAERMAVNAADGQLEDMTARLHEMLVAEIEETLAAPEPSAQDVANAVKRLLGESALSEWDPTVSNTPVAEFVHVGGVKTLVAAYGMLRGGGALPKSRSYLEYYTPENGAWRLKAHADLDFDGCTFSGSIMDAGLPGQAWFLAWGRTFGDTGSRVKLRLYAFDGAGINTLWQRDGLHGAEVTVTRNSVELDYEKEYKSLERRHEMLVVMSDGLR